MHPSKEFRLHVHHLTLALVFAMMPASALTASAQSLDDLNIQVHGYATQGFIYSNNNNWNTTQSTDGSAAWTEAVVNLSAQPESRLRIGVQARYSLLGNYGNNLSLDWAQADFKLNDRLGFRAGKVKTPAGLFNDSQDVDPALLWILLPQSVYAVGSRNSILAHYGAVAYGAVSLGGALGHIEYRAFAGERTVEAQDQDLAPYEDLGVVLPNGIAGRTYGGVLRWKTPVQGLMAGAAEGSERLSGAVTAFGYSGTLSTSPFNAPYFFVIYDHRKFMVAGEYSRVAPHGTIAFANPQVPTFVHGNDRRSFYAMTSYKLTGRLGLGMYYSSAIDLKQPVGSSRFQKDWDLSARYDFDPSLYLKLEQHFIDGTNIGYSLSDNSSLRPNSRMTLVKLGVSF